MLALLTLFFYLMVSVSGQIHHVYGPQWGWYSMSMAGHILSLETTLHPNSPPSPAQQRLALWPGMNTAGGLIQPIIVSSDEGLFRGRGCGGATASQWCVFASVLQMKQELKQEYGKRVPLSGNQALNIKLKWNETLNGYDQWLYIEGKVMSEMHIATGKAKSFYIDSECQSRHTGTVNNHTYSDTTIVLSEPFRNLDKTVSIKYLACADSITSPDQGKTWKIPHIRVETSIAPGQFVKGAKMGGTGGGLCPQK